MSSRPLLLVTLLFLMVFTSQFDWNHKLVIESQARSLAFSNKQRYVLDRRESVKEKFDWNHKIVTESQARSLALSNKQRYVLDRRESVKDKIILSQEKHIQKLKTLVQSLQEQLLLCSRGKVVEYSNLEQKKNYIHIDEYMGG